MQFKYVAAESSVKEGLVNVFGEGPDSINIWGFVGYTVSLTTTQLCCRSVKAINKTKTNEYGCVPVRLYSQILVEDRIWPAGHSC